jgi:hypothetical protein
MILKLRSERTGFKGSEIIFSYNFCYLKMLSGQQNKFLHRYENEDSSVAPIYGFVAWASFLWSQVIIMTPP